MAQRRAPKKPAPAAAGAAAPFRPAPETLARLLPPGLAARTPQTLLDALPERVGLYADMLAAWNGAINLTGARRPGDILERLIPDSFELAAFLSSGPLAEVTDAAGRANPARGPRVWDLGAGGGLPGIPLRMVWERGEYTLAEVREKRALFLANALAKLGLPRTEVWRGPVERLFAERPHGADIILSRAFMPWEKLPDFCAPGLAPGGVIIIFGAGPCGELPAPWRLLAERAYNVGESRRWLWAIRREGGADAGAPPGEGAHA
ncbi:MULTISPECIES: RsmG family class I SAM-dependent methyltransferase [unclassified Desulfovibrio]|uniref:16S rRNA (guanine(527)-N(7))-methyltransferase RsmG n=1 Tax=unclassified Desulfovibrio TaxID=2593640 RepID=UPI0013E9DFE0|nr:MULTISPECIES: RsmG family class I SAM-dependent methyltransferase [unclassified Desulfovibrio]